MADETSEKPKKGASSADLLASFTAAIERSNELAASQAATIERQSAQIADLQAQLGKRAATSPAPAQRPVVPTVPYSGYVRAKEPCFIGTLRQAGEVFYAKLPALWTDDPFEPVTQVGTDRDGLPVYQTNENVVSQHFTLRPKTSEALAGLNATPRKASDWENTDKIAAEAAASITPPDPAIPVSS